MQHGTDDKIARMDHVGDKEPRRVPAVPVKSVDDVAPTITDTRMPSGEFSPRE